MEETTYKFRALGAQDIAPMCKIISKIGLPEFTKCFGSNDLQQLVAKMQQPKQPERHCENGVCTLQPAEPEADYTDIFGLQVILEIANVVCAHLPDCAEDVFALLASVSGQSVTTVRKMDLIPFTKMVIQFIKKDEFRDFIGVVSELFK